MIGIPVEANTGPVEIAIRKAVHEGDEVSTPSRSEPFWIGRISSDGIILELGNKRTPTKFNWACLEGVITFLQQHATAPINGSGKSQLIVPGTLDGYLEGHVNRVTAGWFAALLEKAGVVEIDRARPAAHISAVRLNPT